MDQFRESVLLKEEKIDYLNIVSFNIYVVLCCKYCASLRVLLYVYFCFNKVEWFKVKPFFFLWPLFFCFCFSWFCEGNELPSFQPFFFNSFNYFIIFFQFVYFNLLPEIIQLSYFYQSYLKNLLTICLCNKYKLRSMIIFCEYNSRNFRYKYMSH